MTFANLEISKVSGPNELVAEHLRIEQEAGIILKMKILKVIFGYKLHLCVV